MLFNSLQFVVFFPCVVAVYFLLPHRARWAMLLAASYYFYACWKAEYLVLILASTVLDYVAALGMARASLMTRRGLLGLSLAGNLGLLFAFKYFNFFNDSARAVFERFDMFYNVPAFDVLLPVGISFYTFQSLSYTIDVYRGQRAPERHFGIFALYVSFFPQLVAGPIERSTHLLPQFRERHRFDWNRVCDGLQLMTWGFFKKLVIADRLALYVNEVFNNAGAYQGAAVVLAVYFFAFQIYCDFSAYSDIAIGTARIMGFDIMENFRRPYFATSIADFWRRWHISLSTWFRDYVYIPLGGNRVGPLRQQFNIAAVFLLSGLWHGANWTFVVWGALHAVYYLVEQWNRPLREAIGLRGDGPALRVVKIVFVFHLVALAWFFFRAATITEAAMLIAATVQGPFWPAFFGLGMPPEDVAIGCMAVLVLLAVEGVHRPSVHRSPFGDKGWAARGAFVYACGMAVLVFGKFTANPFIYFQF